MTSFWSRYRVENITGLCSRQSIRNYGWFSELFIKLSQHSYGLKTWFELKKKAWQRKSVDIEFGPLCGPLNKKKWKKMHTPAFLSLHVEKWMNIKLFCKGCINNMNCIWRKWLLMSAKYMSLLKLNLQFVCDPFELQVTSDYEGPLQMF